MVDRANDCYLVELTDVNLLLLRQVHPTYLIDGEVNELAFRCTDSDHGELSVAQGNKTTAEAAAKDRDAQREGSTAGTWGVSIAETIAASVRAWDDTARPGVEDPAHAFIDYAPMTKVERRTVMKLLREAAQQRGCLHHFEPALRP